MCLSRESRVVISASCRSPWFTGVASWQYCMACIWLVAQLTPLIAEIAVMSVANKKKTVTQHYPQLTG